jgi:hypothetical protein
MFTAQYLLNGSVLPSVLFPTGATKVIPHSSRLKTSTAPANRLPGVWGYAERVMAMGRVARTRSLPSKYKVVLSRSAPTGTLLIKMITSPPFKKSKLGSQLNVAPVSASLVDAIPGAPPLEQSPSPQISVELCFCETSARNSVSTSSSW